MILLVFFILLILMFYSYLKKWAPIRPDFYPMEENITIGHRGAPMLAMENTIESFLKAFEANIQGIDMFKCQVYQLLTYIYGEILQSEINGNINVTDKLISGDFDGDGCDANCTVSTYTVTFDIDGLDPAYASGTGTPEPGGITMREAQRLLREFRCLNFIGGDLVEVSPPFDPSGTTALNGATIAFEILCLLAEKVAKDL